VYEIKEHASGTDLPPLSRKSSPPPPNSERRWVYELGICTLEELFAKPIPPIERHTQAFRSILREVKELFISCNVTL
jgi:hypothetical protein